MEIALAVCGFFLGWAANEWLSRKRANAIASRDFAVELASYLTSVESIIEDLSSAAPPERAPDGEYGAFRQALGKYTATWEISELVTSLPDFLAKEEDEDTHRFAILLFDSVSLFRSHSALHYEAFTWLLDADGIPLHDPRVDERAAVLSDSRNNMECHARLILRHGYALLSALYARTHKSAVFRMDSDKFERFMFDRYGLSQDMLGSKQRYYAADGITHPLSEPELAREVEFDFEDVPAERVRMRVQLETSDGSEATMDVEPSSRAIIPAGRIVEVDALYDGEWASVPVRVGGSQQRTDRPLRVSVSRRA